MVVVCGTGVADKEEGEVVGLVECSRLATRRRRSSSLSVTWSWLEANCAMASSRCLRVDLDREESAMIKINESTKNC